MNARTLSGSIRTASVRSPRVSVQAAKTPAASPISARGGAESAQRDLGPRVAPEVTGVRAPVCAPRTVERDGVLYVVGRDGAPLAPVASPRVAESFGAVLARLGVT